MTRDGSYGVYADLENLSSDAVTIKPQETMLIIQPEVAQPSAFVGVEPAIFPAEPSVVSTQRVSTPPTSQTQPTASTPASTSTRAGAGRIATRPITLKLNGSR